MAELEIRAIGDSMAHPNAPTVWIHLVDRDHPEGYRLLSRMVLPHGPDWRRNLV